MLTGEPDAATGTAAAHLSGHRRLPRLLLLSDCSAEASVSGQLLLHRLLRSYPASELTVIEGNIVPSEEPRRLPGIEYHVIRYKPWRYESRLYRHWNTALLWGIQRWLDWAIDFARDRKIEAVLTVAHGHLWILAASVAQRLSLPLHFIIHDEVVNVLTVAQPFRRHLEQRFGHVYRQAASRLCVSPFMEAEYRRRYGCSGTVLLPSRAPEMSRGFVRYEIKDSALTIAYAGSISNGDYLERLRIAAKTVSEIGGTFNLYTNASADALTVNGLDKHIRLQGFVPSQQLVESLNATADVLFLPMSFLPGDRMAMQVGFPSKLADYTAAGLPILIWGPDYSAAARWAAENPNAALCVTDPDPRQLAMAIRQLAKDPALRVRLAEGAVAAGERDFSFTTALTTFRGALLG